AFFRYSSTSSRPSAASSSGVVVTYALLDGFADTEQTAQHFDAGVQLVGISAEALGAHLSTSCFGPFRQGAAQLYAVLHRPEGHPQRVFYHRVLRLEKTFTRPRVADATTEPEDVGVVDLPQHSIAVRTRPLRRSSGV